MMAHNLCYTTLLDLDTIKRLELVKDVDYVVTPNNGNFVNSGIIYQTNAMAYRLLCDHTEEERLVAVYLRRSSLCQKTRKG